MIAINILFILIVLLTFESLYCVARSKKEKRLLDNNGNNKRSNIVKRITILVIILNAIDSFTFLLFKIVGYIPFHIIRNFLYRFVFQMKIEKNVVIYYGLEARNPWNISIGRGTIVGDHCILDARKRIIIGDNVNISTGAWIWTLQHSVDSPTFDVENSGGEVIIQDRVWISSRTNILPGCVVSEGSVIACGAVCTKSTQPYGIYAGIPAKLIKRRNTDVSYEFDGKHRLFL